jgi:hypothetical protein
VRPDVPAGAHVDQFLHAHYYNRVMKGGRSLFEEWFEKNRSNPDAAEIETMSWWKNLPGPPSHEDRMLNDWAPYLRSSLSADGLGTKTVEHLFEIFSRVHAIADHARRISNQLPSNRQYSMDEKTRALAERIFSARSDGGNDVFQLLQFVLHEGDPGEVPTRLWEALSHPKWRIDHIGRSALGEIVGWALPDRFPPRNSRTSKALRSLGHTVTI